MALPGDIREVVREELRLKDFVPIIPHTYGSSLKAYAEKINAGFPSWCGVYALFVYNGELLALCGRVPSGIYNVESMTWEFIEDRKYYEPISGAAIDHDTETVAWTSWNTPYVFLWQGSGKPIMVDLGEVTGGNIVYGGDGNFYVYTNTGNLYKITPNGKATKVSTNDKRTATGSCPCWFAERLGQYLFFPTPYPDLSLYMYDRENNTWTVLKQNPLWSDKHAPGFPYIHWCTYGTLVYFGIMRGITRYRYQCTIGFIAERGGSIHAEDYGILPYSYYSINDIQAISTSHAWLDQWVTIHWIRGILWLTGAPTCTEEFRPPLVQALCGFPPIICGTVYKGDLVFATHVVESHFIRGGNPRIPATRISMIMFIPRHELFKLKLVPAKACVWAGKSIEANEESYPVVIEGWSKVTIMFKSDTDGTLTILLDPDGRADIDGWEEYDTISVTANKTVWYVMTANATRIKLKFSSSATVTAVVHLTP